MPRITPETDREIVAPLAAALAVLGIEELRHPLAPEVVAVIGPTGTVEPTPMLDALPEAIRQADRAREAERTARAMGLVVGGAVLPVACAAAAHALVALVALPKGFGLVVGATGGAIASWRLVAARLAALLDPVRATDGAARRLADEAIRTRALAAWGEDGPLVTSAIATAHEAIAHRPAGDDPEDWDALRHALADAEAAVARARSRVAGARVLAGAASPAHAATGDSARGATGLEVAQPEAPALSAEQRALLAALHERMPTRTAAPAA